MYLPRKDWARYLLLTRKRCRRLQDVLSMSRILERHALTHQLREEQYNNCLKLHFVKCALYYLDIGRPEQAASRLRECLEES